MASFDHKAITAAGEALNARLLAGERIPFVLFRTSSKQYTARELYHLTYLEEVRQEADVARTSIVNDTCVRVEGGVGNAELAQGYECWTIGLYARDPEDNLILFATLTTDRADWVPAYTGKATSGLLFDFTVAVSNSENVELTVNPGGSATVLDIQRLEDRLAKLRDEVGEAVEAHDSDEDAHPYIQRYIEELAGEGIAAHNQNTAAHPDIRTEMARKANQADVYDKATVDSKIANATPPTATGSSKGIVQLSDAVNSTSNVNGGIASTPAAVKSAYDLAVAANSAASAAQGRADSAYNLANTANGTANSALNFAQTSKYRWYGGASNVGTITLPDSGVVVSISWTIHRVMDTLIAGCTAEWTGTVSEGEYNSVIISVPNQNGIFAVQAPATISSDSLSISFAGAAVTGDMTWIVGFVARERPTDYNWNLILTGGRQMRSCFQACIPLTSYYDTDTPYPPTTIYP